MPGDDQRQYRPALGLVPRIAVLPHYETFGHRWVESARVGAPADDVALVGIDERSAALWHEGGWRAYGPGAVTVLTGSHARSFPSGDEITGIPQPAVSP